MNESCILWLGASNEEEVRGDTLPQVADASLAWSNVKHERPAASAPHYALPERINVRHVTAEHAHIGRAASAVRTLVQVPCLLD